MVKSKRKRNKLLLVNNIQTKNGGRLLRSVITGRITGFARLPALRPEDLKHHFHYEGRYISSDAWHWEKARA